MKKESNSIVAAAVILCGLSQPVFADKPRVPGPSVVEKQKQVRELIAEFDSIEAEFHGYTDKDQEYLSTFCLKSDPKFEQIALQLSAEQDRIRKIPSFRRACASALHTDQEEYCMEGYVRDVGSLNTKIRFYRIFNNFGSRLLACSKLKP